MFRGANLFELDEIMDIYARARAFMAQNGNPGQWGDSYPSREMIEEDILSNRLFVCVINGQLEAVFAFILGEDPDYKEIEQGRWLNDEPYGALHRLASAGHRGGIVGLVTDWCLEHCENLRADTHADNKIMQRALERSGFTRCGIVHLTRLAGGEARIAYQKQGGRRVAHTE